MHMVLWCFQDLESHVVGTSVAIAQYQFRADDSMSNSNADNCIVDILTRALELLRLVIKQPLTSVGKFESFRMLHIVIPSSAWGRFFGAVYVRCSRDMLP